MSDSALPQAMRRPSKLEKKLIAWRGNRLNHNPDPAKIKIILDFIERHEAGNEAYPGIIDNLKTNYVAGKIGTE